MAPRNVKDKQTAAVEETATEPKWLSHNELSDYAKMARKEDLSADEMFACFDVDDQGYHINGTRVNAKILTGMYYQEGRNQEMRKRMLAAKVTRQHEGE